jgi:hypothetical protein
MCKYSSTHGETSVSAILFISSFYQYALWHPPRSKPECIEWNKLHLSKDGIFIPVCDSTVCCCYIPSLKL